MLSYYNSTNFDWDICAILTTLSADSLSSTICGNRIARASRAGGFSGISPDAIIIHFSMDIKPLSKNQCQNEISDTLIYIIISDIYCHDYGAD